MLISATGVALSSKMLSFLSKTGKPVSLFQSVVIILEVACPKLTTFLSYKHNLLSGKFFWLTTFDTCGPRDSEPNFRVTGVSEQYVTAD